MFDLTADLRALGDKRSYGVRKRPGRATVLSMGDIGTVLIWLAIIAAGTVAGIYTDSPWGGIIVAAIGIVLSGLLLIRRQPR